MSKQDDAADEIFSQYRLTLVATRLQQNSPSNANFKAMINQSIALNSCMMKYLTDFDPRFGDDC